MFLLPRPKLKADVHHLALTEFSTKRLSIELQELEKTITNTLINFVSRSYNI